MSNSNQIFLFDVLIHTSQNIQLINETEWCKVLRFNPRNPRPQLVEFPFLVISHLSLTDNFSVQVQIRIELNGSQFLAYIWSMQKYQYTPNKK
jgi:hypothetical protein